MDRYKRHTHIDHRKYIAHYVQVQKSLLDKRSLFHRGISVAAVII